ncbi:MAG: hypothetical protein ACLT33_09285 [Lachnospira pectinoschiza]
MVDGSGDEWRPVKKFKVTDKQWEQLLKKSDNVFETKDRYGCLLNQAFLVMRRISSQIKMKL